MRKLFLLSGVVLFMISLHSCVAPNKLYYFHDKTPGKDTLDTAAQVSIQKIQRNDRLQITVSSTDPALTAYLNPFSVQASSASSQSSNTIGYLVSPSGKIEFPLLGSLQVAGLTTVEVSALIKDKLSFYYKDLFVNVNLRGQVYFMNGRQGIPIPMTNERLTILEAISQSGVQDAWDKKNSVWLVRDVNGERVYAQLNLNSKDIFKSPYYYLQNNDLLYMQPGKYSTFLAANSPARNVVTITGAVLAIFFALRNL